MRTVVQKWMLSSGAYTEIFETRADAMLFMSQQWFLDNVPEGAFFQLSPGYLVVDMEAPMIEYHK